jgi:hypothetical protein
MEQQAPPIVNAARTQPYDFHDEEFVTWWLNSLYLFPPHEQLAIAQQLRNAVHAPRAALEIEAFLTIRMQAIEDGYGTAQDKLPPDENAPLRRDAGIAGFLAPFWRSNPWTTVLGVVAAAFFLAKGLWFAAREAWRLVF